MPHHTIALFLEVVRTQAAAEHRGELVPINRVEPYKPAMTYWVHMVTFRARSRGGEP